MKTNPTLHALAVFLFLATVSLRPSFGAQKTWTGSISTDYGTAGNWNPSGVPASTDTVTIVTGSRNVYLDANRTVSKFTITSGTMDLNGFELTITATAAFTSGTINNGTVTVNSSWTTTFSGTVFSSIVSVESAHISLNGSVFHNSLRVVKGTSSGASTGTGGNTFYADVEIINTTPHNLVLGNTSSKPDSFLSALNVTTTGTGGVLLGNNAVNNLFNGTVTLSAAAGSSIYLCQYGTATFNDDIILDSVSGSIRFGISTGSCIQSSGHRVVIGPGGFSAGTVYFRNFIQNGTTDTLNLNPTGTAKVFFEAGSVFSSPVIANANVVGLNGSRFLSSSHFTITSTAQSQSAGGNYFGGPTTIINNGVGSSMILQSSSPDTFASDVLMHNITDRIFIRKAVFLANAMLKNSRSCPCYPFYVGYYADQNFCTVKGNLTLEDSAGALMSFGQGAGSVILFDSGSSLSIAPGFAGSLLMGHIVQQGPDTIAFNMGNNPAAKLNLDSGNVFNGPFVFEGGQITLKGNTYNNTVTINRLNSSTGNTSSGANIFNAAVTISDSSFNGHGIALANLYPDTFNAAVSFIEKGSTTTFIKPAYAKNTVFKGDVTVQGTAATPFGANGGAVIFSGSNDQSINKTGSFGPTFKKTEVNKSAGTLKLNAPLTLLADTFFLTKGVVLTDATNILSVADNGVMVGGSDSSYVHGPVKKTGNDAFCYMLGDSALGTGGGTYHPITISAPGSTTNSYTAQYFAEAQTSGSEMDSSIQNLSTCEHWTLTRNTGSSNVLVSIGWNETSCNISNPSDMKIAGWNGSSWKNLGNGEFTGDTTKGSIQSELAVAVYGPFTLANKRCFLTSNSTSTNETCFNSAHDGTATVSVEGALGSYNYLWNTTPTQTTATATGLTSQIDTVMIIDQNGCRLMDTVTIGATSSIYSLSHYALEGSLLSIDAFGGLGVYSYLWNTSETTNIVSGLSPGTYSVSITDSIGCEVLRDITIPPSVTGAGTCEFAEHYGNLYVNPISTAVEIDDQGNSYFITIADNSTSVDYFYLIKRNSSGLISSAISIPISIPTDVPLHNEIHLKNSLLYVVASGLILPNVASYPSLGVGAISILEMDPTTLAITKLRRTGISGSDHVSYSNDIRFDVDDDNNVYIGGTVSGQGSIEPGPNGPIYHFPIIEFQTSGGTYTANGKIGKLTTGAYVVKIDVNANAEWLLTLPSGDDDFITGVSFNNNVLSVSGTYYYQSFYVLRNNSLIPPTNTYMGLAGGVGRSSFVWFVEPSNGLIKANTDFINLTTSTLPGVQIISSKLATVGTTLKVLMTGTSSANVNYELGDGGTSTSLGVSGFFAAAIESLSASPQASVVATGATFFPRDIYLHNLSSAGGFYIGGSFDGTATFGSSSPVTSSNTDIFIAELDNSAGFQNSFIYGGSGEELNEGIAVNDCQHFLAGGFFTTATLGSNTISSSIHDDIDSYEASVYTSSFPGAEVTSTPGATDVCAGASVTLEASPSGYNYQWYFNGSLISGATNQTLDVQVFQAGTYKVVVTNGCTCNNTAEITFTIDPNCFCVDPATATIIDNQSVTSLSISGNTLSGDVSINGTFTIDDDFTFSTANVFLGPDARIVIDPGKTLTITLGSVLQACTDMWDGIYITDNSAYLALAYSTVQDAKNAIVSQNGGDFISIGSTFNLNHIGIDVQQTSATIGIIVGNIFDCSVPIFRSPHINEITSIGIQLHDVESMNPITDNSFSNMDFGIYIDNSNIPISNLSITGNTFTNMAGTAAMPCPGPCPYPIGTAIYAKGGNTYENSITVEYNSITETNRAVWIEDYGTAFIQNNDPVSNSSTPTFPYPLYGQEGITIMHNSTFPVFGHIEIINNHLLNWTYGIKYDLVGPSGLISTLKINDNEISNDPGQAAYPLNNGIRVSNASNILFAYTNGNLWEINDNTIIEATRGITLYNLTHDPFKIDVKNNTVALKNGGPITSYPRFGIRVQNSTNINVSENNIYNSSFNAASTNRTGISIEASSKCVVHANNMTDMDIGIKCLYAQNPVTLSCNDMYDCNTGVSLNNVTYGLGPQLPGNLPQDNQWFGTSHSMVLPQDIVNNASFRDDWYYRNSPSFIPLFSPANAINTNLRFNAPTYNCPNGPWPLCPVGQICIHANLVTLIDRTEATSVLCMADAAGLFMTHQDIYEQIRADDTLLDVGIDTDGFLQNFSDSIAETNIGMLQEVNERIADSNFTEAYAAIESIDAGDNLSVQGFVTFNTIYLATLASGVDTLTDQQRSDLLFIAQQCPGIFGKSVYRARAFLNLVLDSVLDYRDDCYLPDEIVGPDTTTIDSVPNAVCPEGTYSFAIHPVADAVDYRWFTNIGDADLSYSDTSCTITFPDTIPINAKICVVVIDTNGFEGLPRCKFIETAVPSIDTILGLTAFQCGREGQLYHVPLDYRATSYSWSVSNTTIALIDGPDDNDSVLVNFTSPFDSVELTVTAFGICGNSSPYTLTIHGKPAFPALPDTITAACGDTLYFPFPDSSVTFTSVRIHLPFEGFDDVDLNISAQDSGIVARDSAMIEDFENNIHFRIDASCGVEPSFIRVVWHGLDIPTELNLKAGNACDSDSVSVIIRSPVVLPDTFHVEECCGDTTLYTSEDTTITAAYVKILFLILDGDTIYPLEPEIILADENEAYAELSEADSACFGSPIYAKVDIACNVSPPYIQVVWCYTFDDEHISLGVEQGFRNACGLQSQVVVYTDTCDNFACGGGEGRIANTSDLSSPGNIEVYPNPTKGALTVKINSSAEAYYSLELTDVTGRILYKDESRMEKGFNYRDVDISRFTNGLYFLRFNSSVLNKTIRISKN